MQKSFLDLTLRFGLFLHIKFVHRIRKKQLVPWQAICSVVAVRHIHVYPQPRPGSIVTQVFERYCEVHGCNLAVVGFFHDLFADLFDAKADAVGGCYKARRAAAPLI